MEVPARPVFFYPGYPFHIATNVDRFCLAVISMPVYSSLSLR